MMEYWWVLGHLVLMIACVVQTVLHLKRCKEFIKEVDDRVNM